MDKIRITNFIKVEYNPLKDETTIYYKYKEFNHRIEKEGFKTFKGKIDFKGESPTEYEIIQFINYKEEIVKNG